MSNVIDLTLQRCSAEVLSNLLKERGLEFFLKPGRRLPWALDDRRVRLAVELAVRRCKRLGVDPTESAREACRSGLRRKLITRVAERMVQAGF